MNLAIVIAVSDYTDSASNLPACRNDADLITMILKHSGRFDTRLFLLNGSRASSVKDALASFIKEQQDKKEPVKEVFFYFTGHGDLYEDDFWYLLSDFDNTKRRQTSLCNTELDTMLRALSPALTVKLVDACHSGTAYIKGEDTLRKALEASRESRLNKCYFMFSSQAEQVSVQDAHLSYFSREFGRAVALHGQDTIRYKDVADFIADAFAPNKDQTPTFVIQADLTEVFCTVSDDLRADLGKRLAIAEPTHATGVLAGGIAAASDATATLTITGSAPTPSLLERIKSDAANYCTKEEAMRAFEVVRQSVESFEVEAQLAVLYERDHAFSSCLTVENTAAIAKWLHAHKNDYFVTLSYGQEKYNTEVTVQHPFLLLEYDVREVWKTRRVLEGFEQSAPCPFKMVTITYRPRYPNIPWWQAIIVPVFSKVALRLFYGFDQLEELGWDERRESGKLDWQTSECKMKDESCLKKTTEEIIRGLQQRVFQQLVAKFGPEALPTGPKRPRRETDHGGGVPRPG